MESREEEEEGQGGRAREEGAGWNLQMTSRILDEN